MDEGFIKFNCNWIKAKPFSKQKIAEINAWRSNCYKYGLIGAYPDGVGFGNISIRLEGHSFLITGSATGCLEELNEHHYVQVTEYDFKRNSLNCVGPIKASSESLSHAIIYESSPKTNAVIHIHNIEMWKEYIYNAPTTKINALYGTPQIANEIKRLFKETDVDTQRMIVMGGHQEGIITFGKTLEEAGSVLLERM